ncbi:hypothetical protein AFO98_08595, partial [Staphylococcus aureus]
SYAVAFINLCFKILIFLSTNCGTVYSLNAATVFLCPPYSLAIRGSYAVAFKFTLLKLLIFPSTKYDIFLLFILQL